MDTSLETETVNLLNFIDLATTTIRSALHKADIQHHSKRKINHKKYLQKQLKRSRLELKASLSPSCHFDTAYEKDVDEPLSALNHVKNPTRSSSDGNMPQVSMDPSNHSYLSSDNKQQHFNYTGSKSTECSNSREYLHPKWDHRVPVNTNFQQDQNILQASSCRIPLDCDHIASYSCSPTISSTVDSDYSPQSFYEGPSENSESNDFLSALTVDYILSESKWPDNEKNKRQLIDDQFSDFSGLSQNYFTASEVDSIYGSSGNSRQLSSCVYDNHSSTMASTEPPNEWASCNKTNLQKHNQIVRCTPSNSGSDPEMQVNSQPDLQADVSYNNFINTETRNQVSGLHWSQVSEYFQSCAYYCSESSPNF